MQMPSNGSAAMNRVEAARRSGSRPPWTIPNSAWSGRVWAASERSAQRWVRSVASATTARGELGKTGWSKATAMSEPSASWTPIAMLRREPVERAVEVAAERHAVVVDDPQVAERDDLEAARVGEDRAVPVHEPVQAAEPCDALVAGPQVEVVGVGQDDRGAGLADVVRRSRALTVAFVPTGMNCGVSTAPWVSVSFPARARVDPSAGGGVVTS